MDIIRLTDRLEIISGLAIDTGLDNKAVQVAGQTHFCSELLMFLFA